MANKPSAKSPPAEGKAFIVLSNVIYGFVSATLMLIAIALIVFSLWDAYYSIRHQGNVVTALLHAIGIVVIALAVFDVAKYLMEEEVMRDREMRSPTEARRTMTKFMVIICVVVSLEAVVSIARAKDDELSNLVYPAILLLSAVAVMVGLGVYQKLSSEIETKDDRGPTGTDNPPPSS